ncbi:MAG: hypothetical protein JWR40_1572 [Massilia sp.]|nr:hypothetical protein [Massilia sp.]MDB5951298.1 hypothetical protein [Massilia sp.]
MIRRKALRSMSGTGTDSQLPNISPLESIFGTWSTLDAENRLRVPRARARRGKYSIRLILCEVGLPSTVATALAPPAAITGGSRRSISA